MQKLLRFKTSLLVLPMIVLAIAISPSAALVRGKRMVSQNSATSSQAAAGRSQTLLPDGSTLLVGGESEEGVSAAAFLVAPQSARTVPLQGKLRHPRAWHTATLLPNGKVLIYGGTGIDGQIVKEGEIFDPATQLFEELAMNNLTPRAHHTATLLTDGRVLFAGGRNASQTLSSLELWDYRTGQGEGLALGLIGRRSQHTASLLADGTVLFRGGQGVTGAGVDYGEILDIRTNSIRLQVSPLSPPDTLQLEESRPESDATDVPVSVVIALRFSRRLQVQTVTSSSISLSNNQAAVAAEVVPAESGMLAFVTPAEPLSPGTSYTLTLQGAVDTKGISLPITEIFFTTAGQSARSAGDAAVFASAPTAGSGGTVNTTTRELPALQAGPSVTAVSGQVLQLNGSALPNVTLKIGSRVTKSDSTGRFMLTSVPAGHQVMVIDGATANTARKSYGIFEDGVDIKARITNVLNYKIWMTELDMAHAVTIPSPTPTQVVIKTPLLPGLELLIPAHTVITDDAGKPVSKISITPIPIHQPPFPLPPGVVVPIYFTIQPGRSYIKVQNPNGPQGAQLYYPNTFRYKPKTVFDFWNYDAADKGWYIYGQGAVSADGGQVIPNPGVVIYEFSGAMVSDPGGAPGSYPKRDPVPPHPGDPVDPATGLFVYNKTDLIVPDVIPMVLTRIYRQSDPRSRAFGIGASHPYDMFLVGGNSQNRDGWTFQDMIFSDGGRVHFDRTSPCSLTCPFLNAVYTATSEPGSFYGATLRFNSSSGWEVTKKDGTVYVFPASDSATNPRAAALIAMRDRYGNSLTLTRDSNNANLKQITSNNGRWIQFSYSDPSCSNCVTQASDIGGRTVNYQYLGGRLWKVTDANNGVWEYTYDANGSMWQIKDPRLITYLINEYDANNRVHFQRLLDGAVYQVHQFDYTLDANGNVAQTTVTDPRSNKRQLSFNSDGNLTTDIRALGLLGQEQTVTYTRQPVSGLVMDMTDALNRKTTYTYDSRGNVTSVTTLANTAAAARTTFTYEPTFNQITSITDPLQHTTSFTYDNQGNLLTVSDPLGNTASLTYNAAGQVLTTRDPASAYTMRFDYDKGDLIAVTDPIHGTLNRFVDVIGRLISITDPLGRVTKYDYNPLNQITSVTDALGGRTTFTYDPNGNLATVTDAVQNPLPTPAKTVYTYDSMDRLKTRTDQLGKVESYDVYDGNGNPLQFTDRNGKITTFGYDGLDRLNFVGFGTVPGPTPTYDSTIDYTYDLADRLTQAADSLQAPQTITRAYNDIARTVTETNPQGSITWEYDAAGRRKTMTLAGTPTITNTYTFDDANRLRQITQGSASVLFGYDVDGRRTSLTLPNGLVMSYGYDNASQLTNLTYSDGSNVLGALSYRYDIIGLRTSMGGSYARTGRPDRLDSALYNAANRLTNWDATVLSYDFNGNVTGDGTNTYVWNSRNTLDSMNLGARTFQYDAFGRRIGKTIATTTTKYLYDGANVVQELDGSPTPLPTANLLTGLSVDEVFTRTTVAPDPEGARNFLTDALGSTIALTDSARAFQTTYTYEPFGNAAALGTATSNTYQYTGRENDGTGLHYYRARYYHPQFQRFISEDPIGFEGGGADLYAYAGNSPTNFIDPSGMSNSLVHILETYYAGRDAGLGIGQSLHLGIQSALVDIGTQGTDAPNTSIHAMGGRLPDGSYQKPEQALEGAASVVDSNGASPGYIDPFAIHTIEDSYSGSHNYQPDTSKWLGFKRSHRGPDSDYHSEAIDAVSQYIKDRRGGRPRDPKCYLKPLSGRRCGCS